MNHRVQGQYCQRYAGNPTPSLMSDAKAAKDELRRRLRQRRAAITPAQRNDAAHAAANHIANLPHWAGCRRLGLYLANDNEFDPAPIAALARARGSALYLPVIGADSSLTFAHWAADVDLHSNRYGIPEPDAGAARVGLVDLDLVLVPLVGWDRSGGRLGMGGGYYDRTLAAATRPPLVGLAFAAQEVAAVPTEPWDIALDYVLTERELVVVAPGTAR